jgi:hypothetical protein
MRKKIMFKKALDIIRIVCLVALLITILAFIGTCAWQNCRPNSTGTVPTIPESKYEVIVKVTNNHYFSNTITIVGINPERIVTMQGYFELVKGKFTYKDITLSLKESEFGEIEVKTR